MYYLFKLFSLKVKFTYEIEDSGEITLLDTLLVRQGNDIETTENQHTINTIKHNFYESK